MSRTDLASIVGSLRPRDRDAGARVIPSGVKRPLVESVSRCRGHNFSKLPELMIRLVAGRGVEGDAHYGTTVKHIHRVKQDPTQPNLRQVHLIHAELFDELREQGFSVGPGEIGENITTRGLDVL